MTWSRGSHNLKIGGEYRRQQLNQIAQQNPRGTFTFTGEAVGSDFAGFLVGIPDASSIAYGNADKYFRASSYSGYFAGDWRTRASLTINAGLRWDYNAPVTELYGRLVNLDIAPGFSAVSAARGNCVAALSSIFRRDPRGVRRVLRFFRLHGDRFADGAASAALHEPERREQRGEPSDAGERIQSLAGYHN
jgi:hypothetical protein